MDKKISATIVAMLFVLGIVAVPVSAEGPKLATSIAPVLTTKMVIAAAAITSLAVMAYITLSKLSMLPWTVKTKIWKLRSVAYALRVASGRITNYISTSIATLVRSVLTIR